MLLVASPCFDPQCWGCAAQTIGTSYQAGSWSAATPLGSGVGSQCGGGVAVVNDGRGVATFRDGNNGAFESATWSGSWGTLAPQGVWAFSLSRPVAAGGAAILARCDSLDSNDYARWQGGTTSWSPLAESTGTLDDGATFPVVVTTASGDPLVLFSDNPENHSHRYAWTLRTGGVWSADAALPGASEPAPLSMVPAAIAAAGGVGSSSIVAVVRSGNGNEAQYATFSGGAWSSAATLVTDLSGAIGLQAPFALAGLPDGRVAMAYEAAPCNSSGSCPVKVGFYDGTSWGTFAVVPAVGIAETALPISLARGAFGSAVVELGYIDNSHHVNHVRLTNESKWIWTTPVLVDSSPQATVSIGVGP
jgi:hypothetical protein